MLHYSYSQAQTVFAVIGDFGSNDRHEQDVADLVDSWNPAFVVTVGDNNYGDSYSDDVGQYYHQYMYPNDPNYGALTDPSSNKFWPAIGNHDYINGSYQDYLDYFVLPQNANNNERYYTKRIGDIEFFVINSDDNEPDGTGSTSKQAQWIHQQILNSTATWKIVLFHHPAYCSIGGYSYMRWPFEDWGIDAVISGHKHVYERILKNDNHDNKDLVYFVDGLGGDGRQLFNSSSESGSQKKYDASWGALKVTENSQTLRFQFYNVSDDLIDDYTLDKNSTTNNPPVAASNPTPAENATGISLSPTLSWDCSDPDGDALTYDVYFGMSSTPTTVISSGQSGKTFSQSGLSAGATYYWKIVATDSKGASTDGPVWSFTTNTPPLAASTPSPTDAQTGVSLSPTLSWDCSDPDGDALTYDVYFGMSSTPTTVISSGQNGKTFSQSGLSNSTTYYWKIVATDSKGASTDGPVWSFTTTSSTNTPPLAASNPSPSNNATGIPLSPTLSWDCSDPDGDALTYDVYFGTSSTPTTVVSSGQSGKTFLPSSLSNSTTYYWQIIAKDSKGATTDGPIWSFTTNKPPLAASNQSPSDNATGIPLSPTLSWNCSDPDGDALTYDVYFGTSSPPTTVISSGQSGKTFSQSGLSAGATYYWKIVATDSKSASTDGPVWSFTTVAPTPVELKSFSAKLTGGSVVQLNWSTTTEVNNYGFNIERSGDKNNWQTIGFVSGSGNSNSPKNYSFTDSPTGGSLFNYRLKQIDVGGNFKYYDPISISLAVSDKPQLLQNSPNPFNPSTAIKFYIPNSSNVTITIYNILGREIKTLLDEQTAPGYHVVYWNGRNSRGEEVASGIYLYRLTAGSFSQTKKMNLLK